MALFSRKKADIPVLPEIERYYDAEKRERAGMAWFLAIVSIACVALLLISMFFGGRWIYRKAAHTDNKTGVSTAKITGTDIASSSNGNTPPDSSAAKPSTPTPVAQTPPAPVPTTPTTKTPTTQTPATTPTAQVPSKLVNTGPANTITIFIASVFGFTLLHNVAVRRRRTN